MEVNVKVLCQLEGVFPWLQPETGRVYRASYSPPKIQNRKHHYAAVCVIDVNGKKICLKPNEYAICDENET